MPLQRVGDVTLYYEDQGAGPPVLLLHGLGSSVRDWEHQLPALLPGHRVIAVDQRGHGRSERPQGPYSVAQFAKDSAGLLEQLGLARVQVVGISMGAMVGFQLALDHPEKVAGLVAINAGPELVPRNARQHLQLALRQLLFRLFGLARLSGFIASRLFPRADQQALRETFVSRWRENDERAYGKSMQMLVGWSVVDRLEQLKVPVLLLAADGDYTPVTDKQRFLAQLPTARLEVLTNSRHASTVDQPQQVNARLLDFLRQ